MAKVQISIDNELLARIDKYADDNYMSRSGLISLATSQFLNQADTIQAIKELSACMRKIVANGTVDHETKEQLEEFEAFAKMLCQNL